MKENTGYLFSELFYFPILWSKWEVWPWNQRFSRKFMLKARIDAVRQNVSFLRDADKAQTAINHANLASDALDDREFERAWRNLLYGERLILEGREPKFLHARAQSLKAEAQLRLPKQGSEPVLELLAKIDDGTPQRDGLKERFLEANDVYEKQVLFLNDMRERLSGRLSFLSLILLMLILVFGWYYSAFPGDLGPLFDFRTSSVDTPSSASASINPPLVTKQKVTNPIDQVTPVLLLATFLLGGIGACLSAILSYTNLRKVPGAFEGWMLTAARPIVGATSGVAGIMVVNASLVQFENGAAIGLMAFVFGFSERLIVGAVERLEAAQET